MATKDQTLTLRIAGLGRDVEAESYISTFRLLISALQELNKSASELGAVNVEWRIVAAGMASPIFLTVQGVGLSPESTDFGPRITNAFVTGVQLLNKTDACPPLFTERSLGYVNQMTRVFARGIGKIEFSTDGKTAEATKEVAANANSAIRRLELEKASKSGQYIEYGEIEGHLKELTELSGKDKLLIVDDLTGIKATCYARGATIEQKIRDAWKRRVCVTGRITVDKFTGNPVEVLVDDIRILRLRSELPQIDDISGIDIAGGMESSEYVRSMRDAE